MKRCIMLIRKKYVINHYSGCFIVSLSSFQTVAHEIAHNLGIQHDCINYQCSFWLDSYVGPRDHDGKDCFGYMDYRHDTDEWSQCSVSDFAEYANRQSNFCLEKIKPSSTDVSDKGF